MSTPRSLKNFILEDWLSTGSLISIDQTHFLIGWGKATKKAEPPKNISEIAFYFPDFFLEDPFPWISYEHTASVDIEELLSIISHLTHAFLPKIKWQSPSKSVFTDCFQDLQPKFANENLKKIVPYLFATAKHSMTSSQIVNSLMTVFRYMKQYPLYCYGSWDNRQGVLGATPELLFEIEALDHSYCRLNTMACAGTAPLEAIETIDHPKNLEEHKIVVEDITKNLSRFGKIILSDLSVKKFPKLAHLVTPITLLSESRLIFDAIVKALHPTAALGGIPRIEGMLWLKNYQKKHPRKSFGAPVGCFFQEKMLCYVAIRNVQWDQNFMSIGAGCGMIKESLLDQEWDEIQLKIEMIKELLGL